MIAYISVDMQNDFGNPNGALYVVGGELLVDKTNQLLATAPLAVASQDWHPANHKSFAVNNNANVGDTVTVSGIEQFQWPVHCVQNEWGAELIIDTGRVVRIFQKGLIEDLDSYSAFFDNAKRNSTGLHEYLQSKNVKDLYVSGLATDYCVKYTVLHALELGYNVYLIVDGCRAVNINACDAENAILEMVTAGARLTDVLSAIEAFEAYQRAHPR